MNFKHGFIIFTLFFLGYAGVGGAGQGGVFQSGPDQVVLLELFTSEGCSSCPPADEWMRGLKHSPYLWKAFVPAAFHVDYWDYLGWKDALGREEYSQRQRDYTAWWRARSVYTPMIVKNGAELKEWYLTPAVKIAGRKNAGTLRVERKNDKEFEITFLPHNGQFKDHLSVNAAYLGCDISSRVEKGENSGKMLEHDFAVLSFVKKEIGYQHGALKATVRFDSTGPVAVSRHAIAVWITHRGTSEPLQAAGGFLD